MLSLSRPIFGINFPFLANWFNTMPIVFNVNGRKQEKRGCSTLYNIFKESPTPSKNRLTAFEKSQVRPGIRTRLTQSECHYSTSCAVATAEAKKLIRFFLSINWLSAALRVSFIVSVGHFLQKAFFF